MKEALKEGKKALPACRPNPPVGSVIVKGEKIISRGYTNEPGKNHAEAMAIEIMPKVDSMDDVAIFATLEPCSFKGRTPSCAKSIVKSGFKKVFVGMLDPHPKNRGAGVKILEEAGIDVEVGICHDEVSKELNPYLIKK